MPEKEKIQISIYQIDIQLFTESRFEAIVKEIMKKANEQGEKYSEDKTSPQSTVGCEVKLFYSKKTSKPRWVPFLRKILTEEAILSNSLNIAYSFILFIGFDGQIFSITGGTGAFSIDRYIVQTFGIDVLTRLIEKNSKVIKYIQDRGVTGALIGQTKFYRGDQRLSDETQFGKIYKQVQAELDQKILKDIFGFKAKDLIRKRSGCLAKTSFKLNKSIDFETLLRVIKKTSETLLKEPNFTINNVLHISKKNKANTALIGYLKEAILLKLYSHYENNTEPDFDFCNKEIEKYLTANSYKVSGTVEVAESEDPIVLYDLFQCFKQVLGYEITDEYTFKHFVLSATVEASDEDGILLTRGSVIEHIHGEVVYNNKIYFTIDNEWYEIHSDFIKNLNTECQQLIADVGDDSLFNEKIDINKSEREFNSRFIGKGNTLVFDTITPENIEACDILQYGLDSVLLIHVKKGFNNSIRDLTSQILIAARRLAQDRKTGFHYISSLEQQTLKGITSNSVYRQRLAKQEFPINGLKGVFETKKGKQICFCLAFVDEAVDKRNISEDISLFDSNIAKYSLLELRKEIYLLGFDFKIIQLEKAFIH